MKAREDDGSFGFLRIGASVLALHMATGLCEGAIERIAIETPKGAVAVLDGEGMRMGGDWIVGQAVARGDGRRARIELAEVVSEHDGVRRSRDVFRLTLGSAAFDIDSGRGTRALIVWRNGSEERFVTRDEDSRRLRQTSSDQTLSQ